MSAANVAEVAFWIVCSRSQSDTVCQARLGHSSINITMDLYSHLLDGMDDEAANKIDQALRAAMKKRD